MPKLFFKYLREKLSFLDVDVGECVRVINENIRLIGWVCGWVAHALLTYQIIKPRLDFYSRELAVYYWFGIWLYPVGSIAVYQVWRDYRDWLEDHTEDEKNK